MKKCGEFHFEPTKESFPIRVGVDNGNFEIVLGGNYGDKKFRGKDVGKLRSDAYIYLKDLTDGKWEPFVIVEHSKWGIQHDHQIYLEYKRVFRLKKSDGTMVWKTWNGPDGDYEGEPGNSTYGPSKESEEGSYIKVLPYSKEVWNGLLAITKAIKTIDKKIKEMIAGPGLEAKLKLISTRTQNVLGYVSGDKAGRNK